MANSTLTQARLVAEARARFGDDKRAWAFVCPNCGDVAAAKDFTAAGADPQRIGQDCIGRFLGALDRRSTGTDGRAFAKRGCDWTAYGLFPGPWTIETPDGRTMAAFELAPATPAQAPVEIRLHTLAVLEGLAQGDSMVATAARTGADYDEIKASFGHSLRLSEATSRSVLMHRACIRGLLRTDLPRIAPDRSLTAVELRLVRHSAAGETREQIARRFNRSLNTVKEWVRRALVAQHAAFLPQLVYLAWRDGLLGADLCTCHDGWPATSCPVHRGSRPPVMVDVHLPEAVDA